MSEQKTYRYPGVKYFTEEEQTLFFGRKNDTNQILELLDKDDFTVLYGKSGIGKTSLLKAGIIPILKKTYKIIFIELKNKTASKSFPLEQILQVLKNNLPDLPSINKHIDNEEYAFGYYLKNIQKIENKPILIIFDQFERFFDFSSKNNLNLKEQLTLVFKNQDDKFNQLIQKYNLPEAPLMLKIIISIRNHKLNDLIVFSDFLPGIFSNVYELGALSEKEAYDAIVLPAQKKGHFYSQEFEYQAETLNNIMHYLKKGGEIEPFLLQLICRNAENVVIEKKEDRIASEDLGDIDKIFENYYHAILSRLDEEVVQKTARILIEDGLVFDQEQIRISLYEGIILKNFNVDSQLLHHLVNSHLLRAKQNNQGKIYYELANDIYLPAILEKKQERKAEERRQIEEIKQLQKEKKRQIQESRRRKKQAIVWLSITVFVLAILGYSLNVARVQSQRNLRYAEIQTERIKFQLDRIEAQNVRSNYIENLLIHKIDSTDKMKILSYYEKVVDSLFQQKQYNKLSLTAESFILLFNKIETDSLMLSQFYNDISWYLIYNKQYMKAISYAEKGLNIDKKNNSLQKNIVIALLFNEKYSEAQVLMQKNKHTIVNGLPFRAIIVRDLETLQKDSLLLKNQEKVRKIILK